MITYVRGMTVNELANRKDDLIISNEDIHEIAKNARNKAVDEFAERLKEEYKNTITTSSSFVRESFEEVVNEIAEQMKGGAE